MGVCLELSEGTIQLLINIYELHELHMLNIHMNKNVVNNHPVRDDRLTCAQCCLSDQQMVSSESKALFAMLSPLPGFVICPEIQRSLLILFLK